MDLMKIPSMGSTKIARALFKVGLEKLSDLGNAKALTVENVLMDLGGNFFVSGKSTEMEANELAKLLIKDARNHVECEMGLKRVEWRNEEVEDSKIEEISLKIVPVEEEVSEPKSTKRKAESQLESRETLPGSAKKPKNDYRKKLRSSGGKKDFKPPEIDVNASLFKSSEIEIAPVSSCSLEQFLTITDVAASSKTFEVFKQELLRQNIVGMAIGVKKFEVKSSRIGGNLLGSELPVRHNFTFDETFYIECISFCYNGSRICHLNLQNSDPVTLTKYKNFLSDLLKRENLTLITYEAREVLKALQKAISSECFVSTKLSDPRIASWLIDPDTNLTWHEMVSKYSPCHLEILKTVTEHMTKSSLGLSATSTVEPKIRSAVECFLSNSLLERQLEVLKNTIENDKLLRVFQSHEMMIQAVLLKMEISGFPINVKKLQSSIEDATMLQRQLEQRIYELHGRKFNLSSSTEVSKVVGIHKNLENKKKLSTAKNVLEKLDLPIANCIMTWRTLDKTIANMQPKIKLVKGGRIFGNSFSLTQTGRISMYEPNLQNVTKDFDVEVKGEKTLSRESSC